MNQLVKAAWIKLIENNPRTHPYYLLNKYYEEATGEKLLIKNQYAVRAGAERAPKYFEVNPTDLIQPRVAKWAGLDSIHPQLPSYSSEEFKGLGLNNKGYKSVGMIWQYGVFSMQRDNSPDKPALVKVSDSISLLAQLMERDL